MPRLPPLKTHRFRMASRREAVAPAVDQVLASARPVGLDEDRVHDLAVVLAEALSNAAVHGNRLRDDLTVQIVVGVRAGHCLVVDVRDAGRGFDVAGVGDPTKGGRLLEEGGRGVFLMRRLVDRIEFNASGNRVRLTLYRERAPESGSRRRRSPSAPAKQP